MLDFLAGNSLFVVLTVVLVVWAGIFIYLLRIDRKVKQIEDKSA